MEGVEKVINDLIAMTFGAATCDLPAASRSARCSLMHFADEALIVTNPEVSSVRDSDRILGILRRRKRSVRSRAASSCQGTSADHALQLETRERGRMLSLNDIQEILRIELIGAVPESEAVLHASNQGLPAVHLDGTDVAESYKDIVSRSPWRGKSAAFHRLSEARFAATHLRHQVRDAMSILSFLLGEKEVRFGCEGTLAVDHCARGAAAKRPPIICRRCNGNSLP